eukprot:1693027-Pyramimonas_sp.AAC.1
MPKGSRRAYASTTTGAFGGAPHGATKSVRGVPTWVRRAHTSATIRAFSGGLAEGHETCEGCAKTGARQ